MDERDTGDSSRPDGRVSSEATLSLRSATRALRLHLRELPSVVHHGREADLFLAEAAFPFARFCYESAEALIGAGFGGTVLGALARSVFVDGLRWQWIGEAPVERRTALLGSMLEERNGILDRLERHDATCPILPRWFAPLLGVTDLTGASPRWWQAPSMPDEQELLDTFLSRPQEAAPATSDEGDIQELLASSRQLLGLAGLRGAVMVLAHAGHGNLLGLQSSLAEDGVPGHDLRPDHEALFTHAAAVGVTVTLLGVCVAAPECWPAEVDQKSFLARALELTGEIAAAATVLHGLGAASAPTGGGQKIRSNAARRPIMRGSVVLPAEDLMPDCNDAAPVLAAAERYEKHVHSWYTSPYAKGNPKLASVLAYGGAHSTFQAVMTNVDNAPVAAMFAARMLLEEAARFRWLTSETREDEFMARSKRYFDEFRSHKKKTISLLTSNGVPTPVARKLLELPSNVFEGPDDIAKGRERFPSIENMLLALGEPYAEPGWLSVAYSLLSQVTHSTPIGVLHLLTIRGETVHLGEATPEMLGLALDVACLGSAHLLGLGAVFLTHGTPVAFAYSNELRRLAAAVHDAARWTHGLD